MTNGRTGERDRRLVTSGAAVFIVFGALGAALATGPIDAQRPERAQDGRVPARGILLKARWQWRSYDGCQFAVPGSWHAAPDGSSTVAPDGSNLTVRMFRIKSWSDHKAQIKRAFGRVNVVHEDSDRRLWFEIGDTPRVQHFIEIVNGLTACNGLLEIRAATTLTAQDTNTIADSIRPAPAH
jgi:hypothetical protein